MNAEPSVLVTLLAFFLFTYLKARPVKKNGVMRRFNKLSSANTKPTVSKVSSNVSASAFVKRWKISQIQEKIGTYLHDGNHGR